MTVSAPNNELPPLGLHPLKKVAGYMHVEPLLPLVEDRRNTLVQKLKVPTVHNRGPLPCIGAWTHCKRDASVIELYGRFFIFKRNAQEMMTPPPPHLMCLSLYQPAQRFAALVLEARLLVRIEGDRVLKLFESLPPVHFAGPA